MEKFLLDRLQEDNTYIGLFLLLGAALGFDFTNAAVTLFGVAMVAAPEGNLKRAFDKSKQQRKAK